MSQKAQALVEHLEKLAKEIEAPMDVPMNTGVKEHAERDCAARAAGIRDAIRAIKYEFDL